jgi:hypothetical protein
MYRLAFALSAFLAPLAAGALQLSDDNTGQGLIYPYYTVQTKDGNAQNTFISIVNHTTDAKAVRLRVREGRNGRQVAQVNVYLSPRDTWTAAVVATTEGAALITTDKSCTRPQIGTGGSTPPLAFTNNFYTGSFADTYGNDTGRLREGWIEAIEMSTLQGGSATGVTHTTQQVPADCTVVDNPNISVGLPTGGISGTLTVINVANGLDFSVNAVALANLSINPFYRPVTDSYPDFNSVEINPVSIVVAGNAVYRSAWNRAADAVSAVLMRSRWMTEYTIDAITHSGTDIVVTFPTRQFYSTGTSYGAPFATNCADLSDTYAGEPIAINAYTREELDVSPVGLTTPPPAVANYRCSASSVADAIYSGAPVSDATAVFGSINRGYPSGQVAGGGGLSGWVSYSPTSGNATMRSLGSSIRFDLNTGAVTTGAHLYTGLPVVGFGARTFINGLLDCGGVNCQGNYGSAFPFKTEKKVAPTP